MCVSVFFCYRQLEVGLLVFFRSHFSGNLLIKNSRRSSLLCHLVRIMPDFAFCLRLATSSFISGCLSILFSDSVVTCGTCLFSSSAYQLSRVYHACLPSCPCSPFLDCLIQLFTVATGAMALMTNSSS